MRAALCAALCTALCTAFCAAFCDAFCAAFCAALCARAGRGPLAGAGIGNRYGNGLYFSSTSSKSNDYAAGYAADE